MSRRLLVPLALPLLVTAAVLMAVTLNRTAALEPIDLTERELSLRPRSADNSVATMFLQWQQRTSRDGWFDCAKLRTLGLECDVPPADADAARRYGRRLPRQVFVAFELGGAAWDALMAERATELESAAQRGVPMRPLAVDDFRDRSSRLIAVDADRDATALRQRYPDARRFLITAAVVRIALISPPNEQPYLVGLIDRVDPGALHVPLDLAARLPRERGGPDAERRVRYRVSVRYGRRVEPFITAIDTR
jgi:hypothetical protein